MTTIPKLPVMAASNEATKDRLTFAKVEYPKGYWHFENDKFRYMTENDMSGKTNAHIEVAVRNAKSGRFIDDLDVMTTLKTKDGRTLGTMKEHLMWHPWLYDYGENWRIPASGTFTIVASIQPPACRCYGKTLGNQFSKPATVTFDDVQIKSGQK